jgi:plasmid stabilization system protein ParE
VTTRTTEATDRDIADLYADGEAQFGIRQAERYQNRLFDLIADDPAFRASGVSSRHRSASMPTTRISSSTRSTMRAC